MISKKIKSILKKNVLVIDRYTPRCFKSDLLSVALARSGQYNKGCARLPRKTTNSLAIDIEFKSRRLNEAYLLEYICANKKILIKNVNRLFFQTFVDFIAISSKYSIFDADEWQYIFNVTKKKYKIYLFELVEGLEFIHENTNINLITQDVLRRIKAREEILKIGYNPVPVENEYLIDLWFCKEERKLNYVSFVLQNKEKILFDHLTICFVLDLIASDYFIFSSIKNDVSLFVFGLPNINKSVAIKKLNALWTFCEFDKYREEYARVSNEYKLPKINEIKYFFIDKKYDEIIRIYKEAIENNRISTIKSIHLFVFYSYCEISPMKLILFFEEMRFFNVVSNMYDMYESLYYKDISKYLYSWSKNKNGLQDYLNYNIPNNFKYESLESFKGKKLLVIAEAGVGDELRYSKLYGTLEHCDLTVICDPRLLDILQERYEKVNFIPHKRDFSRKNKTIYSYHNLNIPRDIDFSNFDFCLALSAFSHMVTSYSGNELFKNKYLNSDSDSDSFSEKIKVGIFWSSSLLEPIRQLRYSLTLDDYISVIDCNEFDFIAIQSNMTEKEKITCRNNNISYIENIDTNDDFNSLSLVLKGLDYVIGPSSFNTELASFFGVRFLHLANTPETILSRSGNLNEKINNDIFDANSILISPSVSFNDDKNIVNQSCVLNAVKYIKGTIAYE